MALGLIILAGCNSASKEEKQLAHDIANNENFLLVKEKAKAVIATGFSAGDENIIDAYVPKEGMMGGAYEYIFSKLEPDLAAHKNTDETDQESSLIQGVYKYVTKSGLPK